MFHSLHPRPQLAVYTARADFAAYRGRNQTRLRYLQLLADEEARRANRASVIAGRVLLITTILLGFLI